MFFPALDPAKKEWKEWKMPAPPTHKTRSPAPRSKRGKTRSPTLQSTNGSDDSNDDEVVPPKRPKEDSQQHDSDSSGKLIINEDFDGEGETTKLRNSSDYI